VLTTVDPNGTGSLGCSLPWTTLAMHLLHQLLRNVTTVLCRISWAADGNLKWQFTVRIRRGCAEHNLQLL